MSAEEMSTLRLSDELIKKVPGRSLTFQLDIKKGRKAFRYDVEITKAMPEGEPKLLTKQSDLGLKFYQRQICQRIISQLHTLTNGFGSSANFLYDGKSMLFSSAALRLPKQQFVLESTKLGKEVEKFLKGAQVTVTITPNDATPVLDYSDLRSCLTRNPTEQTDDSARQFIELAITQYFVGTGKYDMVSAGTLFEQRTTDLVPGIQLRDGLVKGIRVIEVDGQPKALLVLDMRRSAFFSEKPLNVQAKEFCDDRAFVDHFRGVRIGVKKNKGQHFPFKRLTDSRISDRAYNMKGKPMHVWYKQKHNINCDPNARGCHPDILEENKVAFPLEVCEPLKGQLVPSNKLKTEATNRIVLENSKPPQERYEFVKKYLSILVEGAGKQFLAKFGIEILPDSNRVDILEFPLPQIQAAGFETKQGVVDTITTKADGLFLEEAVKMKFIKPASGQFKWLVGFDPKSTDEKKAKAYVQKLKQHAQIAGLLLPEPIRVEPCAAAGMVKVFSTAQKDGVNFILHLDDLKNPSHARLKLCEVYFKILTQQIATKNLEGGVQVLKNVLMKTNVKRGGLNYLPKFPASVVSFDPRKNPDLLVIGLDVNHPEPASPRDRAKLYIPEAELQLKSASPSCVGICANKGKDPADFSGNYFFQQALQEAIDPERLRQAVREVAEEFKKNGRTPSRVLVLRDGLSEGEVEMAFTKELQAIKEGVRDVFVGAHPVYNFIIATKKHNKRFFKESNNVFRNTAPGNAVLSGIVQKGEWFQQSHMPLKGVPKMVQYLFCANELNLSKETAVKLMLCMSCMHQVSAGGTSLPLPVYMASELAKRGRMVFDEYSAAPRNACFRKGEKRVKVEPPADQAVGDARPAKPVELIDFDWLSGHLSYAGTDLGSLRFNA